MSAGDRVDVAKVEDLVGNLRNAVRMGREDAPEDGTTLSHARAWVGKYLVKALVFLYTASAPCSDYI